MPSFKDMQDDKDEKNVFIDALNKTKITYIEQVKNEINIYFSNDEITATIHIDINQRLQLVSAKYAFINKECTSRCSEIVNIICRKLSEKISIIIYSKRYKMNYDALHRFKKWHELDDYHKCYEIRNIRRFTEFKYILKNWSIFEQYFRTHLWARQMLISFLTSRNKLHLLSCDKYWIIEQTPEFWLYEFLNHGVTNTGKRYINRYRNYYGIKQNTLDIYNTLVNNKKGTIQLSHSTNMISIDFLSRFNIKFPKKSKYMLYSIYDIYNKIDKRNNNYQYIKDIIITNSKSILTCIKINLALKENKEDKNNRIKFFNQLIEICGILLKNCKLIPTEVEQIISISTYIERHKLINT